jgi:carboxyl-terminal processing protease
VIEASCNEPPDAWTAFCEAYDLIQTNHLEPPGDRALATAAAGAIDEVGDDAEPRPDDKDLVCALPSDAFEVMCQAMADEDAGTADLAESALRGMVAGLDPFSSYLSPEAAAQSEEEASGTVEGIGAVVRPGETGDDGDIGEACSLLGPRCRLVIVSVIEGSPAEAAGILPGDITVAVDGEPVAGHTVDEIVEAVRGPAGTDVELTLERDGKPLDVVATRAAVTIPNAEWEVIEPGVGLLRLYLFSDNSPEQVREALEEFVADDVETVILDLQGNPGGSLAATVRIASEFLLGGDVVRTEGRDGALNYPVRPDGEWKDEQRGLVVLLDRGSASASEVLAAVLQERGRGVVIGENSFGKNTVQQQFPLEDGSVLRLTIGRWVTPEGQDFGGAGVTPNVEVEIPADADAGFLVDRALSYIDSTA